MLDDERRVLSQRGVVRALTKNAEKNGGPREAGLQRYLGRLPSKYEHLATGPEITFIQPQGGIAKGREGQWFVELLKAYDEAGDEGLLHPSQLHLARNALRIIFAMAGVGIVSLSGSTVFDAVPAIDTRRKRVLFVTGPGLYTLRARRVARTRSGPVEGAMRPSLADQRHEI